MESSSPCAMKTKKAYSETGTTRRSDGRKESEAGAMEEGERYERCLVAVMATAALASTE